MQIADVIPVSKDAIQVINNIIRGVDVSEPTAEYPGRLDSALSAIELFIYFNPYADIYDIAVEYADRIACNHVFVDGNKRTSLLTIVFFLDRNGYEISWLKDDLHYCIEALVRKKLDKATFSDFLRNPGVRIDQIKNVVGFDSFPDEDEQDGRS